MNPNPRPTRDRVTARLYRTNDGEIHREYVVDGIGYSSLEELEHVMERR